jgi:hypothetical protein
MSLCDESKRNSSDEKTPYLVFTVKEYIQEFPTFSCRFGTKSTFLNLNENRQRKRNQNETFN